MARRYKRPPGQNVKWLSVANDMAFSDGLTLMKWLSVSNDLESTGKHWTALEITGNHWKSLESTGNHWKALEITGKH
jgi:hypothetical protein